MDTYIVTNYGQCRCCLTKGNHKDMMKEYYRNGIREVYIDIYAESFGVYPSRNPNLTTLICTQCIERLQDASDFKMMVINSEQQLLDALNNIGDEDKVFVFADVNEARSESKLELPLAVKEELSSTHSDAYSEDWSIDDAAESKHVKLVEGEAEFLARFPPGSLTALPTRASSRDACAEYFRHLDSLKGKVISAKMLQYLIEEPADKITPMDDTNKKRKHNLNKEKHSDTNIANGVVSEKMAHVANIATLLEFSNLTAFKTKYKNGFPCFYCNNIFDSLNVLREHQTTHVKVDIRKLILKKYRPGRPDCLVVYADIYNLKCTICNQNMSSLNELKSHLFGRHKKKIYTNVTDRVIPFKMAGNSYECQICNFDFETFGAIERHMNTHYRNYVCNECGSGFITKQRLKVHTYSLHAHNVKTIYCDICKKEYTSHKKFKIHYDVVHKMLRKIKCSKCPARFADYFVRQKHLVDVHGDTPILYTCRVCDKSFSRRFSLSRHIKKDHLEERDVHCSLCSHTCFTSYELKTHMVKKHGERLFECAVCKKSYASQKSLADHLRIHNDDKRFACDSCGLSFVQRSGLKAHLKSHYLEDQ
ncbi:zinc finger protein 568-like [Galleria mellonella]|uniref:Zinc finger protein 568-like n=1 Tax=Galleria mellonella TaxID=7137 RepID=A0A6J3C106_GALME|nr:zinc finger protein 568-like [Galleria mellonella]